MITVIGRQPSADTLRQALADVDHTVDVVVNWGARASATTDENVRILNANRRLNAIEQLVALDNVGLTVPSYTQDLDQAVRWVADGFSVWGRRLEHTQGIDIVGFRHKDWARRDWWVGEVAGVEQEWRIHVFMGRTICRGLKVQTSPATRRLPVRSRRNGWTLVHDVDPPQDVRDAARRAVRAVGYDFGAVDILQTVDGPVVLEVNSAPAIRSPLTLEAYKQAILKCAHGKYQRWYTGEGYEV